MLVLYGADVMIEEGDPERQGGRGTGKASFFGAAEAMGGGADSSVPMPTSIVLQAKRRGYSHPRSLCDFSTSRSVRLVLRDACKALTPGLSPSQSRAWGNAWTRTS